LRLGGNSSHLQGRPWASEPSRRKEGKIEMDNTTIIRIVAGVLFVIVLVILIQRRRTRIK
jgi:hypothetical protein